MVKKTRKQRAYGRTFDGVSRPSNDEYRERWDEIFGKKESDSLKQSYQQSLANKKERDDKK